MSRIVGKSETVLGVTKNYVYSYDNSGRLVNVVQDGVSVASFGYDSNGNRTSTTVSGTTYTSTFDDQDRMQNFGSTTYDYDASGNVTQSESGIGAQIHYYHDFSGNLIGQGFPGSLSNDMDYDFQNRIIHKKALNRGVEDFFVYDQQDRIAASFTASGTMLAMYQYPTGGHSPDVVSTNNYQLRLVKDHLGSPVLAVDMYNGSIVQVISYNVLGKEISNSDPSVQPFGFAGGLYDTDTLIV
jgi:YD repeat-containing protein